MSFFLNWLREKFSSPEERLFRLLDIDNSLPRWFRANELLHPRRFDLAAKLIYARLRERNVDIPWAELVYKNHLSIWNDFYEEAPRKNNYEDFKGNFDAILDATKATKWRGLLSLIPLSVDGYALNGAHRIAAAIHYNREILATKIDISNTFALFDYKYFRRLAEQRNDLNFDIIWDSMALVLCELMPNSFVITKFPAGEGKDEEVDEILKRYGDVIYERTFDFTPPGQLNLIRTLYEGESWLGSVDNDFHGARNKARDCFSGEGPTRFIIFAARAGSDLIEAKRTIRDLFQKENHSLHINDRHDETLRIGQAILNPNSIHFLNHAKLAGFSNFERLLPEYRRRVAGSGDPERFCVDGSAVLSCYGLRDCNDLDYLHHGAALDDDCGGEVSSHNKETKHYSPLGSLEIIYDPRNHFYFRGLKFASLDVIRAGKKNRDEAKDRTDLALIDALSAKN